MRQTDLEKHAEVELNTAWHLHLKSPSALSMMSFFGNSSAPTAHTNLSLSAWPAEATVAPEKLCQACDLVETIHVIHHHEQLHV